MLNYAAIFVRPALSSTIYTEEQLLCITYVYVSGDLEAKHCLTACIAGNN